MDDRHLAMFMLALTVALAIAWLAHNLVGGLRDFARLLEGRLPKSVTDQPGWYCRFFLWFRRCVWTIPATVPERVVIDAMAGLTETLPDRVPVHRLRGRGARAKWEITLFDPIPTYYVDELANADGLNALCVGRDPWGEPVCVRGTESLLVVGITGSGKSGLMNGLILRMLPYVHEGIVQLWGIDLKGGVEMAMFGDGVFRERAYDMDTAIDMLRSLSAECGRRAEVMRGNVRKLDPTREHPRIVLIIDEAAELHNPTERKKSEEATRLLDAILRRGRALGVFVIAFSQDPRVSSLPLRERFPQRIALRLNSKSEASMLLGDDAVERGAVPWLLSSVDEGAGFLYDKAAGRVVYFRAPWVSDEAMRRAGA